MVSDLFSHSFSGIDNFFVKHNIKLCLCPFLCLKLIKSYTHNSRVGYLSELLVLLSLSLKSRFRHTRAHTQALVPTSIFTDLGPGDWSIPRIHDYGPRGRSTYETRSRTIGTPSPKPAHLTILFYICSYYRQLATRSKIIYVSQKWPKERPVFFLFLLVLSP